MKTFLFQIVTVETAVSIYFGCPHLLHLVNVKNALARLQGGYIYFFIYFILFFLLFVCFLFFRVFFKEGKIKKECIHQWHEN